MLNTSLTSRQISLKSYSIMDDSIDFLATLQNKIESSSKGIIYQYPILFFYNNIIIKDM